MTTERPTLAAYICQTQHEFEWKPKTGTHNAPTRNVACTDCETAAALAVEWANSERAELGAWIREAFLKRWPDLRLPEGEAL